MVAIVWISGREQTERGPGRTNLSKPSEVYTDSSSLVSGLGDGTFNSPRRAIIVAGLEIKAGEIAMTHIAGKHNISDLLTKSETPESRYMGARQGILGEATVDLSTRGKFGRACARDFL